MRNLVTVLTTTVSAFVFAQAPDDTDRPLHIGDGVTAPKIIKKVEPTFSNQARENRIQGTVILEIIIDRRGHTTDISIISPLGFGLDEHAIEAVSKWEFVPGKKEGNPVKIIATVEVNFRFPGLSFDDKYEHERSDFNVALNTFNSPNATPAGVDRAVRKITDLCHAKFPPAMHLYGMWLTIGDHVPKDPAAGFDLIQKAAAKNYGPAIYEIAARRIDGRDMPKDVERGLQELRDAAILGSRQAQFALGTRYETGDGVPREPDRARRYYRLCATQGVASCQYRLGRMLYDSPDRQERDFLQAIAYIQLAADQGHNDAKKLASIETPKLTPAQTKWVLDLKRQIVRK